MSPKLSSLPLCLLAASTYCLAVVGGCSAETSNPGFDDSGTGGGGNGGGNSSSGSGGGNGGGNGNSSSSGSGNGGGNGGNSSSSGGGNGGGNSSSSSSGGGNGGGNSSSSSSGGGGNSSSSSSGAGSSSGSSSGANANGTVCSPKTAMPPSTFPTGGLPFSPANWPAMPIGMGGYAYAFGDQDNGGTGTSMACLNGASFCVSGSTGVAGASTWGSGAGLNLNEPQGASTPGTYAVPSSATGVNYTLSNLPAGTLYMIIDNSGTAYYATVTAAGPATIPWSMFKTTPWLPDASAPLGSAPQAATHINFQMNATTTAGTYSFCVTSLKFM